MNTAFFEKSKQIANEYLQNIVFLDDKAFENNAVIEQGQDNQHAFDSSAISKVFAKEKKVCAVYKPIIESDIEDFKEISKKADVVILDWLISLQNDVEEDDLAVDADEDDPRGQYTKQIIKELIESSGNDSLKLIIIYTGEDILEEITQNIFEDITQWNQNFQLKDTNCEVCSKNIRILVRGKFGGDNEVRFKQRPHLLNKILSYECLPSFVLTEFATMTSGLLSNFALLSLTTIRNNSHKILSLFSTDLDPAYLSHKSLLPHGDDAEQMLHHLLKDSIGDLLFYHNTGSILSQELINDWVDLQIKEEKIAIRNKKGGLLNPAVYFSRDKRLLNNLLFSKETNVEKKYETLFKTIIPNKDQFEPFLDFLFNNSIMLFFNNDDRNKEEECNKKFAKLTHHKSLFLPANTPPILTLGTIIKSVANNEYYLCIQQKCDSVRIKEGKERKFLFLPMAIVISNKFDIVTHDGIKLKLDKKSFAIKTMKFKCESTKEVICGKLNDKGNYTFKHIYNEEFEWVLDLKDLHSQRIVVEYASLLSRVGLDESEWLRRASN